MLYEVVNLTIGVGIAAAFIVLLVIPNTRWFENLNLFESTTTLEEILDEEGKDNHAH